MMPHRRLFLLSLAALPLWLLSACAQDKAPKQTFDCTNIPDAPLEINQLEEPGVSAHPSGYHDLAFDREGWVAGHDRTNLIRATRQMQVQVISSAITSAEGMEYLPDGRLVVAASDGQGVVALSPNGALVSLAPDLSAFSIVLGPDSRIYSANDDKIVRIDPDTGATEDYLTAVASARVLNFSPDFRLLYVGDRGENVYVVDLDDELNPVGPPRHFATLPGNVYQDGLAIDVCGNLYVPKWPDILYRVTPDGTVSIYHKWAETAKYGHGLKWGSGLGGFRRDALYSPQPWNDSQYTVVEVVVGVPGHPPGGFPGSPPAGDPHELTCGASGRHTRAPGAALALFALALFALRRRRRPASGGVRHSKDVIPD